MKFPDISRLGSVTVGDAGHFVVVLIREDLTPGEVAGILRGKIARAKYPLDAYDAGIEDVIDAARVALAAASPAPLDVERPDVQGLVNAINQVALHSRTNGITSFDAVPVRVLAEAITAAWVPWKERGYQPGDAEKVARAYAEEPDTASAET